MHYVAIIGKNSGSHHFFNQGSSPVSPRQIVARRIARYLGGILAQHDCQPIIIGGVEDHVHILATFSRTHTAAELIKEMKRGSSLWLKAKAHDLHGFAWQNGYGIFSIGFSQVETVRNYIAGQEEHHRKVSFQDELGKFLKKYEVEFDERYVWV